MCRIFFNIWPFLTITICQMPQNICQHGFTSWQNTQEPLKKLPKTFKIWPKWRNLAKSGHTGLDPTFTSQSVPECLVAFINRFYPNGLLCHTVNSFLSPSLSLSHSLCKCVRVCHCLLRFVKVKSGFHAFQVGLCQRDQIWRNFTKSAKL